MYVATFLTTRCGLQYECYIEPEPTFPGDAIVGRGIIHDDFRTWYIDGTVYGPNGKPDEMDLVDTDGVVPGGWKEPPGARMSGVGRDEWIRGATVGCLRSGPHVASQADRGFETPRASLSGQKTATGI